MPDLNGKALEWAAPHSDTRGRLVLEMDVRTSAEYHHSDALSASRLSLMSLLQKQCSSSSRLVGA